MTAIRTLALVLFAFGGYLNATYASLGGPANLIIIGAVLCIALSVAQVATLRAKVGPLGPLLIIALAFGYGIAAADTFSLYGGTKLGLLLTLTPLSFLVGAWLVDTEKRRVWLAAGVAGWGFATVLVQQLSPDQTLADVGRLAGEDLSYQALSRAAAASAVVFAVFALASRFRTRWRLAGFVTALSFAAVAIGGGSRGPLIGLVIAVTVVAFRTRAGAWLGAGAVLAAWYLLPILLLPFVPDRVFSIEDSSTRVRADAASLAIDHIRENFLGTGFGS
ncbi:MAG: hypothetical protein H5T92_06145, partial [Synergistales bacterium]|nr:hypothetical protein [Synergistales bacterium]